MILLTNNPAIIAFFLPGFVATVADPLFFIIAQGNYGTGTVTRLRLYLFSRKNFSEVFEFVFDLNHNWFAKTLTPIH